MTPPPAPPPNVHLLQLITGKWVAQAVSIAARFKIADLLADGPRPVAALARETGPPPGALYRVLRALAGVGVFAEGPDGRFSLPPPAEFLRSGVPGSLRG